MDELEALRQFRSSVPVPAPEVREAAKAAVLSGTRGPTRWSVPSVLLRTTAVAMVGAVVALFLALMLNPLAHRGAPADAAAVRTLLTVSARAAVQPALRLPHHGYLYSRSTISYLVATKMVAREPYQAWQKEIDRETWIAADGSGRVFERSLFGRPPPWRQQGYLWRLTRVPFRPGPWIVTRTYGRGSLNLDHVDGLSIATVAKQAKDTTALTRSILAVAGSGSSRHLRAFLIVGDLLRQPSSPPQLRAGLFAVLARLHPVGVVNPQVTNGQWGIAVYIQHAHQRYQLDFNAKTTALLGEQQYVDSIPIGSSTLTNQEVERISYKGTRLVPAISNRSGPLLCGIVHGQNGTPISWACG